MYRFARVRIFWALSVALIIVCIVAEPARAQSSAAAGKELTVERIYSAPSLSGHLTEGIEWVPDSKRISYLARNGAGPDAAVELWTMDAATGARKVLVSAETLRTAMQPEKQQNIQATGLGRVAAENYMWAPDARALLFAGSSNLVLLDLATMKAKALVTGEADVEDPKFSPDGKWVSFVRDSNLWVVNIASGETKALTTGGSEEILKGKLDWVYPEELERVNGVLVVAGLDEDRLLRDGRAAGDALSDHGYELADRARCSTRDFRRRASQIRLCAWEWCPSRAVKRSGWIPERTRTFISRA